MFTKSIVEVALEADASLTSILVRPDAEAGLPAGAVGRRLFTIRAADSKGQRSKANILVNRMYATRGYSRRVLASLFHVAYIIAHRVNVFDDLLIEVNPHHVRFYERMLGFAVQGLERLNPRVNARRFCCRSTCRTRAGRSKGLPGTPKRQSASDRSTRTSSHRRRRRASSIG